MDDSSSILNASNFSEAVDSNRENYSANNAVENGDYEAQRKKFLNDYSIFIQRAIEESGQENSDRIAEQLYVIQEHFTGGKPVEEGEIGEYPVVNLADIPNLATPQGLQNHLRDMDRYLKVQFTSGKNADAEAAFMEKTLNNYLAFSDMDAIENVNEVSMDMADLFAEQEPKPKNKIPMDVVDMHVSSAHVALRKADPFYVISSSQYSNLRDSMYRLEKIGKNLDVLTYPMDENSYRKNAGTALNAADDAEVCASEYTDYKLNKLGKSKPNELETKRINAAKATKAAALEAQKHVWDSVMESLEDLPDEKKLNAVEEVVVEGEKYSQKSLARLLYFKLVREGVDSGAITDLDDALSFETMEKNVSKLTADPCFKTAAKSVIKSGHLKGVFVPETIQNQILGAFNKEKIKEGKELQAQINKSQPVNNNIIDNEIHFPGL